MGLMKKLTSALVASSLVFSLVGTAAAAYTPAAGETAGKRMQDLKILTGYADGTLQLNNEITRAELVTVIVRAFGKEADAQLLKGSTAFPDIANHWASGNIAMAKALVEKAGGDAIGMPDGSFAPDAKLTPAQAVAFLMKFIGVKADAAKAWPNNYLDVAVEKNLITAEDKALIAPQLNSNATRGLTFYLFDRAFFSYDLGAGKTFYTKYVDPTEPMLTVNAIDATTIDSKVTITGNVKDAVSLFVGTTAVTPDAAGNFTATYDLPELKEYPITVTARDLAGNTKEVPVKVTRIAGTAAVIEASDITVAAGGTVEVKAVVKDAKGNVVVAPVTGIATAGNYADGKYTAGTAVGTATLTLKAGEVTKDVKVTVTAGALASIVPSAKSAAPGEKVTFTALDAAGNTLTTGVTYSQTSADAMIDATTGAFIASKAGTYTVSATMGGTTVTGTVGVYGAVKQLKLGKTETMVANGSTEYEFTVEAQDVNGNVVADFEDDITIVDDGGFTFVDGEDVVAAEAGVATFTITVPAGLGTGEVDITFESADVETAKDFTGTLNTTEQVATALKLSAPSYLAIADEFAKGTVKVIDQVGVGMVEGSWEVTLKVAGPADIDSVDNSTDPKEEELTLTVTGTATNFYLYALDETQLGTITTTASFTGFPTVSGTTTAAIGLDASKIVLKPITTEAKKAAQEGAYLFQLQITDKNGVPRNVAADTDITLTFDNDDADQLSVAYASASTSMDELAEAKAADVAVDGNDEATVTVSATKNSVYVAVLANNVVGSIPFTAEIADFTKASGKVEFVAGDLASVEFTRDDLRVLNGAGVVSKISAQILDAAGNERKEAGVKVEFATDDKNHVRLNGAANASVEVKTDANGIATVEMVLVPGVDTYEVTAAVDADEDGEYDAAGDTLAATLVDNITASLSANTYVTRNSTVTRTTSFIAGEAVEVRVTAKDNNGLAIEDNDALAAALEITGPDWEKDVTEADGEGLFTWNTDGYYAATIHVERAGSISYSVLDNGIAAEVKTAVRSLSVAPTISNELVVAEANSDDEIAVTKGKVKAITLRVADEFGNMLSADKVREAVSFEVTLTDKTGSDADGDYYEVRKTSETGPAVSEASISAGKNSYTLYVLTNDPDEATLTVTSSITRGTGVDAVTTTVTNTYTLVVSE